MALIEIHAGAAHIIKNNVAFLHRRFNKEQLYSILIDMRNAFGSRSMIYFNSNGIRCAMPPAAIVFRKKGNILKNELADFLGYFISDRRNIMSYYNCLDEGRKKLIEQVLRNYFINIAGAQRFVPELDKVINAVNSYYYFVNSPYVDRLPWLCFFSPGGFYYASGRNDICFAFDRGLHRCFASAILPEVWKVDESADTEGKNHFNAESEMSRLLMMVEMLDADGQLQMNQNKLPDSVVKRISTAACITEFFPETDKGFANLRSMLMLNFFAYTLSGKGNDYRKLFEAFTKEVARTPSVLFSLFGRHIRGLSAKYRKASAGVFIGKMADSLRSFSRDKAVSVEQYVREIIMNDDAGAMTLFDLSDIYSCGIENKLTGIDISPVDIVPEVSVSLVYGFVALLASLGAAEIWYDTPGKGTTSYFSSISHFRLTSLGEYMLCFRDSYEAPVAGDMKMELSPDSFVITLPSEGSPLSAVLSGMAEKIGPMRYITSNSLMLNGCRTIDDIVDRMNFFRKTSKEMPPNWSQLFVELMNRCQPLKAESLSEFCMYSISPDNTDLQRLLSTDTFLKSMVIRAEGYRILVYDDDLFRFKERLRQLGYLF